MMNSQPRRFHNGFSDDRWALAAAGATVAAPIKPEHQEKAADQAENLFGKNGE